MITRMKKVTLLCMASEQEQALSALRDLGIVHLEHVKPPEGAELDQARARLEQAHVARRLLEGYVDDAEAAIA